MHRAQPAQRPLVERIQCRWFQHLSRGCCLPYREAIPPVGRLRLLEGTQFEGQPGMARCDQVVAHFPRQAVGGRGASHMTARALLPADERVGEIDHTQRVAGRMPARQRVGHQPVAGRSMARLAADAVASERSAACRMAADAGGVFVGRHRRLRGSAGGQQCDDLRGKRFVKHPFGPRVRIAGGPDGVAALPCRMPLHRRRMAARRRATACAEQRPRRLYGPGGIGCCRRIEAAVRRLRRQRAFRP